MSDVAGRPSLYLVKSKSSISPDPKPAIQAFRPSLQGSSIILEAHNGQLAQNIVNVSDPRDATAIINGLVMALIHALRIQQKL